MQSYRTREMRRPVNIGARMRKDAGWSDAVVRDISTRGVMAICSAPPMRGEFVELRCGSQVIVAQVVWARQGRFGARVRERLDLADFVPGLRPSTPPRPVARHQAARFQVIKPERRSIAEQAEASRRTARVFEFAAMGLAGTAFALVVASTAYQALAVPLSAINAAFSSH